MGTLIGIDEAGRGPVLGPMVMCGVVVEEGGGVDERLRALGVKDSKLLTPDEREKLYPQILALVKSYKIVVLEADVIDAAISSSALNLNKLEAHTSADILNALNPDAAIIDCPSNNVKAYTAYLKKKMAVKCVLVVEHKADTNHVEAGAASILAKVTRDREIEKIKKEIGNVDFGSGYPSDPKTVAFLEKNWNKYDFFRKSWDSWQRLQKQKSQMKLGEF